MSTAVVGKNPLGTVQSLLLKYKEQIAMAIPEHLTPERLIRVALTAVSQSPSLLECAAETICGCVVQCSILGLEPSSELKEAYLVPFWNSKTRRKECQLIPGYIGLVKLARNTSQFSLIDAQPVHFNDQFEFQKGSDPWWMHKWERRGDRGPIDGYWAGYVLKDGGKNFEYMTVPQIDEHRDKYSKGAYKTDRGEFVLDKDGQKILQGPWKDSPDWMYRKTPLKQVLKLAPKSVKLQTALALDEHAEAGIPQQFSVDVPIELQPVGGEDESGSGSGSISMPQRKIESPALKAKHLGSTNGIPIYSDKPARETMEHGQKIYVRKDGIEQMYFFDSAMLNDDGTEGAFVIPEE